MTDTQRGRTERQQEERTERRRRDDANIDGGQALKLAIPLDIQDKLAKQGREGRWVNDVGDRIYRLTKLDDWDKVEGVEPRAVKIDRKSGEMAKAVLLSKPKEFIVEDRQKKDEQRRAAEKAMLRGQVPNTAPGAVSPPSSTYVVPGSSIGRGNQIIE